MTIVQQTSLAYKGGGSDKVYHAQVQEVSGGYNVNFQYGKRGATLITGCKNKEPVSLEVAQKEFKKLVNSKTAKGYSEAESGSVFQSKDFENRITGVVLQLLNKITNPEYYIENDDYFMQEKEDGHRRAIKLVDGVVTSINKKGLEVLSPEEVIEPIFALNKNITVDGELIGNKYRIFDILQYEDRDVRQLTALDRYKLLKSTGLLNVVPTFFTKAEKRQAFEKMSPKEKKSEGVVFKKVDSPYIGGRPSSGGDQLKSKFYATDTFEVVSHHKTRRSVNVVSYTETGVAYDMGNITIPENTPMPDIGDFVEIRYLYCYEGGKLFQTTFLNVRDDQDRSDCHMKEIKFKSPDDDEED